MDSEVWLGLGNDQTLEMAMWPMVLYKILSDVTSCDHFKNMSVENVMYPFIRLSILSFYTTKQ